MTSVGGLPGLPRGEAGGGGDTNRPVSSNDCTFNSTVIVVNSNSTVIVQLIIPVNSTVILYS